MQILDFRSGSARESPVSDFLGAGRPPVGMCRALGRIYLMGRERRVYEQRFRGLPDAKCSWKACLSTV